MFTPHDFESLPAKLVFHQSRWNFVMIGVPFRSSVFRAMIYDDESAAHPKRSERVVEHQSGVSQFVIGVGQEHGVGSAGRQARVIRIAMHDADVVLFSDA